MSMAKFYNGDTFKTDGTGYCRVYAAEVWHNGSLDENNDVHTFKSRDSMTAFIRKLKHNTFSRGVNCKAMVYLTKNNGKSWYSFEHTSLGFCC